MRKWINLVEGVRSLSDQDLLDCVPQSFRGLIPVEDLRSAAGHLISGHSLDGIRNHYARHEDDVLEEITDALRTLEQRFASRRITIYRSMTVDIDRLDLSKPTSLGLYWTTNENFTMGDLGFENDEGEAHGHITLDGSVDATGVDWSETIPLTLDGVEDEIRLLPKAEITRVYCSADIPCSTIHFA